MQCYVYRGDKKEDHYLFLAQEFDQENLPSNFPVAILGLMGELSFVVEFDLDAERKFSYLRSILVDSKDDQENEVVIKFSNPEINVAKSVKFTIPDNYTPRSF